MLTCRSEIDSFGELVNKRSESGSDKMFDFFSHAFCLSSRFFLVYSTRFNALFFSPANFALCYGSLLDACVIFSLISLVSGSLVR